jgi:hypothetical protein
MLDFTGKKDAISIKEEYQKALDYTYKDIENKVRWLYKMNHKLKDALAKIQKYKRDIVSNEAEKHELYNSLYNLLLKETDFEHKMLSTSKKNIKKTTINIKPKFKDSEIEDFKLNAMQNYLDKYPRYASKSSFKNILNKITEIEHGIKKTKKKYNQYISEVLRELSYWPRNIMEAEDKVKRFKDQLNEGRTKLSNMRYLKSIFYKLSSEREKRKVNIHTLYYRIEEYENTIKKLKEEVAKAKRQDLEEMNY